MGKLKFNYHNSLFVLCVALLSACSTLRNSSYEVEFNQDSSISFNDSDHSNVKTEFKKKGEILKVDKPILLVESPGKIPLLIFNESEKNLDMPVRYTVSLHNYEGWDGNEIEKRSNLLLSEVLSEINTIYAEMSNTHYEEALIKITILQNKYPRLTYLKFIQASCLLLLGKNQQAKIALDEALMEFPNQTEGLKLYKLLNAKAFRTPANTKTDQKQDSNLKQDTDVQNE